MRLASALDDILDLVEAVADQLCCVQGHDADRSRSLKLADILYHSSVAVGAGIDRLGQAACGCDGMLRLGE